MYLGPRRGDGTEEDLHATDRLALLQIDFDPLRWSFGSAPPRGIASVGQVGRRVLGGFLG